MLEVVSARAELTTCAIHSSAVARFGPAHSVAHSTRMYTAESPRRAPTFSLLCSVLFCSRCRCGCIEFASAPAGYYQKRRDPIETKFLRDSTHQLYFFSAFASHLSFATSFRFESSANFTTLLYLSKRFQQHKHVLVLHSVLHAEV